MAEKPNFIQNMKKKMARNPSSPAAPFLLLFLLLCSVRPSSAAAGAGRGRGQLGFFYTRARGRCTPQYWSSIRESWPRMVPPASTVWKAFGSRAVELRYGSGLTLLESTGGGRGQEEDAFRKLLMQGTAALLNSYARNGYPFKAWEVKTLMIQATVSEAAAAAQARVFANANEACN